MAKFFKAHLRVDRVSVRRGLLREIGIKTNPSKNFPHGKKHSTVNPQKAAVTQANISLGVKAEFKIVRVRTISASEKCKRFGFILLLLSKFTTMKPNSGICIITCEELTLLLDERFEKLASLLRSSAINNEKQKDELLTRKEAVEFLKISYPTLHNWTKNKVIRPVRIGGRVYYQKAELLKFLSS